MTLRAGTWTVLFTDVVGSTDQRVRLGDAAVDQLLREHDAIVARALAAHGGELVEGTGDGAMCAFAGAADALAAAVAIQQRLERRNRDAPEPLQVRVGVSLGDLSLEDGSLHGLAAHEAARVCAAADPAEILVTEVVRTVAGSRAGCELMPGDELALKGLPSPVRVWRVAWEPAPEPERLAFPQLLESRQALAFSGREGELATVLRAWKDASGGSRRCVVVAGEPGIGKTRLVAEASRVAYDQGALVLYGRCDEDLGVPFQPFAEALDWYVARADDLVVGRWPGDLARLAPQLRDQVRNLPPPLEADPESEQYRLFDAVASWLTALSGEHPVVVVLDDLHWATKPTLLMLRHVVRTTGPARLLLVVTYRETDIGAEHPLAATLAALHREPGVERITLGGLDADALGVLLEAAGYELDTAGVHFRDRLLAETDGNPFFATELLRHLAETGAISQRGDGRWIAEVDFHAEGKLPTSVREVIGGRAARLGEETEQILRAAAVIGRDFELNLLAAATGQSEDDILDLLDGAIRADLIAQVPHQPGRLSFAHALVEHTLYADLGPTRRQRLHLRVASALETLCGDDPGDRVSELAYHWAQASQPADTAKAIEYALRAGDDALAKLAPDDAVAWYGQALELLDRQPGPDELARCEALVGLGIAQRGAGDARYRDTLLGAADLAQRVASPRLLVRAALASNQLGRTSVLVPVDQERVDALEAALTATHGTETPQRAMVLATLAAELTRVDPDRARALSDEALVMARRADDDLTLWGVLERRPFAIWSPATLDERTANAHELREVAERLGDRIFRLGTANTLVNAAACRGDLVEVDEHLDVMIRVAGETGLAPWRDLAATSRSWRQLLAGHIEEAEQAAREAFQIARRAGEPNAFAYYGGQMYAIRRAQGRLDETIDRIEQNVSENPGLSAYRAAHVSALCSVDRLDDARAVLEPLAANRFTDFPFDLVWLTSLTYCAEAAASLEHRAAASLMATLLAPWRDQLDFTGINCNGSVARPLGLALATAGRLDEANEAFAQAAAVNERIDAPIDLARTQVDWARMLASRDQPGDPDRARALLHPALIDASNLGLATIQRQAQTLLSELAAK